VKELLMGLFSQLLGHTDVTMAAWYSHMGQAAHRKENGSSSGKNPSGGLMGIFMRSAHLDG